MKIQTLAGTRTISDEPPRSTAYYYADLERLKRKNGQTDHDHNVQHENHTEIGLGNQIGHGIAQIGHGIAQIGHGVAQVGHGNGQVGHVHSDLEDRQNPNELSEYVESNEVVNDGAVREVPPLRDRQWSLPEYSTPENRKPDETYSTAGTFPMPEPKEKEPLLAELEVVGRLPLTQLESASGVRRSRSWYLCCPNVGEEEISRESSWRYSSLRPVTAPPLPGRNGILMVATQSSGRPDDAASLRVERDSLARALATERQRAATAARAHDARLAELHGVIAELVRRRAADKQARAIPEEEGSDECESTTQPAGELDNDADRSRTEQNDTSSMLSPDLPTPQEKEPQELPDDTTDTSTHEIELRVELPREAPTTTQQITGWESSINTLNLSERGSELSLNAARPEQSRVELMTPTLQTTDCDTSLNLSERDSELCLSTARCCQYLRHAHAQADGEGAGEGPASGSSCERQRGSPDGGRVCAASSGRSASRQAKVASRVRLRRTDDSDSNHLSDEAWCAAAERLALAVGAQADLREALVSADSDGCGAALQAAVAAWRARCARLEADCRVLHCALAAAADTAHRLSCACAVQESSCVSLCCALRAADRALEAYDVLLALAETHAHPHPHPHAQAQPEREAAELVARQLLARLDAERTSASIGEPLLSPGPWLQHDNQGECSAAWGADSEARLRRHAARLKADTVALRALRPPPQLFSYHDGEEEETPKSVGAVGMAEMEAAVMMQEVLSAREARAAARAAEAAAALPLGPARTHERKSESRSRRRARESRDTRDTRHWLERAAETDL